MSSYHDDVRVVARAQPLFLVLLMGVGLFFLADSVRTLQENGWFNPKAFFDDNVRFGGRNPYYTVPWLGHLMAAVQAAVVVASGLEFATLAAARFNAITFDGAHFRDIGLLGTAKIDAKSVTSARWVDAGWIEIRYLNARQRKKRFLIMPMSYRETIEAIIANLAACGVVVERRRAD